MITRTKPLKRTALKRKARKKQPGDDPKYLAWIRTLPCWICNLRIERLAALGWERKVVECFQFSHTEAAHVGDRGYGQKCPDREAMPLCAIEHHRLMPESHHVLGKNFWTYHNLDRDSIIRELNERYNQPHVSR